MLWELHIDNVLYGTQRGFSARDPYFFFFNDTATTEIYTLSLHDALPISHREDQRAGRCVHRGIRHAGDVVALGVQAARLPIEPPNVVEPKFPRAMLVHVAEHLEIEPVVLLLEIGRAHV